MNKCVNLNPKLLNEKALKISFIDNILYALKKSKNMDLEIIFIFSGFIFNNQVFKFKERISCFCGVFNFKNIYFNTIKFDREIILNMIVDNFHYGDFAYMYCIEKFGNVECHGHGEFWGTDKFTFVYKRI